MATAAAISLMQPQPTAVASEKDADAALVRRFLDDRDPLVFAELIRKHEQPVFRLAASILGPGHEAAAEDLTQEIFVHVYHKVSGFRFASRFSTWLYRVAYRKAIDEKRKARYQRPHLEEAVLRDVPAPNADPLRSAVQREESAALRSAVERLREPQRTAVLLFYWMESSIEEIAEVLSARPATVRSYLFRARKHLRATLQESP